MCSDAPASVPPPASPAAPTEPEPPRLPPAPETDWPALGRLTRGLAALFWALPLSVILGVQTAQTPFLGPFGFWPALGANLLLGYAVCQLGRFRPDHPRWQAAVERARMLALVLVGLSPFLHWYHLLPHNEHFQLAVVVAGLAALLFAANLSDLLCRLTALLDRPDLHDEARLFLGINLPLLGGVLALMVGWAVLIRSPFGPSALALAAPFLPRLGFATLLLGLLPLALTMILIWKIKQALLDAAFSPRASD